MLAATIITVLRLARDPRAGCQTERVVNAVEDVGLGFRGGETAVTSEAHVD